MKERRRKADIVSTSWVITEGEESEGGDGDKEKKEITEWERKIKKDEQTNESNIPDKVFRILFSLATIVYMVACSLVFFLTCYGSIAGKMFKFCW